jgi:hypothetical protein
MQSFITLSCMSANVIGVGNSKKVNKFTKFDVHLIYLGYSVMSNEYIKNVWSLTLMPFHDIVRVLCDPCVL